MNLKYINEIKKLESPPKIIKLFSSKEIKDILALYFSLPERTFNKKQNIRKKVWIQKKYVLQFLIYLVLEHPFKQH